MNNCIGFWGKWFGHDFHPCYDTVEKPGQTRLENFKYEFDSTLVEVLQAQKLHESTYVKHVCIRCGKVVKRDE